MMKKSAMSLLTMTMSLVLVWSAVAAIYDWVPDKTKHGVETFYREVENSPIKEYKAVCEMDYPIEVLLEVLIDVPSYPQWMPDCMQAEILKEFNKGLERGNYYIHLTMDGIWPARNRDLVIESVPKTDWEKGVSVIRLKKLENYPYPQQKGIVRIEEFVSEFKFEYITREKTRVSFCTYVDVGGAIPPGFAAIQTSRVPLGTLLGLNKMAAETRYREAAARDYF
ncbi:MAG: hypothetical protein KKD44_10905 [Proteobacteria bacterium]|nr:hypothetical protein [Pseudomonadota bacterium]